MTSRPEMFPDHTPTNCPACAGRGVIWKGQRAGLDTYVDCGVCDPPTYTQEQARRMVAARARVLETDALLRQYARQRFAEEEEAG